MNKKRKGTYRLYQILVCGFLALYAGSGMAGITLSTGTAETKNTQESWDITVVEPSCTQDGYSRYENLYDGSISIRDEVPAAGHRFGPWEAGAETGEEQRVCTVCGAVEKRLSDHENPDLPMVRFTGSMEGISKSDRITLGFSYTGPDMSFSCYAYTTWQGHASLAFPKKNYTVRLYDDEQITRKHKLVFRKWQNEHKYILKANYRDPSQARNLVAAGIWADMARCRKHLYPMLAETSNYGAVDGFPVAVYLNDQFLGLYTMNLHIDDDLYRMKGSRDAVLIANESEPEETRFHAPAAFADEKHAWEVEYCASEDSQWAQDKLNELIQFVMESDDEAFRTGLGRYLDVDGAIDYLIYIYAMGLPGNAAKDLVLLTYDGGPWIPTVYDMEHAFGLTEDGMDSLSPMTFLPEMAEERWDSNTGSLLWDRVLNGFMPEIRIRYRELRRTVLTEEMVSGRVTEYVNTIPEEVMKEDLELYPRETAVTDPLKQMLDFIHERFPALDEALLGETMINGNPEGQETEGM